jgi:hypothetical protein
VFDPTALWENLLEFSLGHTKDIPCMAVEDRAGTGGPLVESKDSFHGS